MFSEIETGLSIDFRLGCKSNCASEVLSALDRGWLEETGLRTSALVENPTRLRLPAFKEPGNDAEESGVFVSFMEELIRFVFRREDVDGGLRGRATGKVMAGRVLRSTEGRISSLGSIRRRT